MSFPVENRPAKPFSEPLIKVVDDDALSRGLVHELAALAAEEVGISVQVSEANTLTDLKEALQREDMEVPDVVLLDLMLPGFNPQDTLDTVRQIRASERTKNMVIIGISGVGDPHIQDKAKESGMDDYIPKPFDNQQVIDTIKNVLAMKQASKAQRNEHG